MSTTDERPRNTRNPDTAIEVIRPGDRHITTNVSPCSDRMMELAGRDTAVAVRLREEARRLDKLADALEANSSIATHAAAAMLVED